MNSEPLIMVASPTVKLDTIIASGNPELVVRLIYYNNRRYAVLLSPPPPQVTITNSGLANTHDWLPFSNNKSKSFTFELDHNIHLDK